MISFEDYGFTSDSTLLDILNQKIVVEFIPAVYKGETFDLSIKEFVLILLIIMINQKN